MKSSSSYFFLAPNVEDVFIFCCILVAPTISPEVMDQTQNEADTASFTCQATGEPVPTIIWYFNSALVDEANTMKYTLSIMSLNITTNSSTLTIMNVQSSDVGIYTCNATNVVSTDTSSGVLTVNGETLKYSYFIFLETTLQFVHCVAMSITLYHSIGNHN